MSKIERTCKECVSYVRQECVGKLAICHKWVYKKANCRLCTFLDDCFKLGKGVSETKVCLNFEKSKIFPKNLDDYASEHTSVEEETFSPVELVENIISSDYDARVFQLIDDRDIPKCNNPVKFIISKKYLGIDVFPMQLKIFIEFFSACCLKGNSLVYTRNGLLTIKELYSQFPNDELSPLKIRIGTPTGWEKTSHFGKTAKVKELITIYLENGALLTGTIDHKVFVIDKEFNFVWKELQHLDPTDMVQVKFGLNLWPDNEVKLPKFIYNKDHCKNKKTGRPLNTCSYPKIVDIHFARLLGYLTADGSIGDKYIGYTKCDESSALDVIRCFKHCFGEDLPINYFISREYTEVNAKKYLPLYNVKIAHGGVIQFMQSMFNGKASYSHDKKIPKVIRQSPKHIVIEYLRGYFDGDGNFSVKSKIRAVSSSRRLIQEIQVLLTNIGIYSTVKFFNANFTGKNNDRELSDPKNKRAYIWIWPEAYKHGLLPIAQRKIDMMNESNAEYNKIKRRTKDENSNQGVVLYGTKDLCRRLKEKYSNKSGWTPYGRLSFNLRGDLTRDNYKDEKISRILKAVKIFDKENYHKIIEIMESMEDNFRYFKISKISRKIHKTPVSVYDFTIPKGEQFIANSMTVHNCPFCSNMKYLRNIVVDTKVDNILDRMVPYKFGVCPKCHRTRYEAFEEGKIERYDNLIGVAGQRSSKSTSVGIMSATILHQFLTLKGSPVEYFGLLPNSTLHGTFVGIRYADAFDNLWEPFYNLVKTSRWFQQYHSFLQSEGQRIGVELVKVRDTFIAYKWKNIGIYPSGPDKRSLRGRCLVGSTLINTNKGFIRADNHEKLIGATTFNGKNKRTIIDHVYQGKKKVLRATLANGIELNASFDHRVLTLNEDGSTVWSTQEDLKNRYVFCQLGGEFPKVLLLDEYNTEMTMELAVEIGDLLNSLRSIHEEEDEEVKKFYKYLGLYKTDSLPWCILEAPKDCLIVFLKVIFRTNNFENLNYFNTNLGYIKDLQLLLMKLEYISIRQGNLLYTVSKQTYLKILPYRNYLDANLYFSKVVELGNLGDMKVYDLSVDADDSLFPANNVLVHNTRIIACLSSGSLINTSKGLIKIEDTTLDHVSIKNKVFKVKNHFNNGEQRVFKITTTNGFSIKATVNHKFLTRDQNLDIWKKVSELQIGDSLSLNKGGFSDYLCLDYKNKLFPPFMTKKLGKLLGELTLNNYTCLDMSARYLLSVCGIHLDYISDEKAIKESVFDFINYIGGTKVKKEVPWSILQASKDVVVEYLNPLISYNYECIESVYQKFLSDLQILFLKIGVITKINQNCLIILNVKEIIKESVFHDKIESITEGSIETVYDLEIDSEEHAYVANGFIVHNSLDEMGWFMGSDGSMKLDPDEVYNALDNSLMTVQTKSRKMFKKHPDIPTAVGMYISSPSSKTDKSMRMYKQSLNSPRIYGFKYCVTGDTLIPTSKGLRRIDSLIDKTNSDPHTKEINLKVMGETGKVPAVAAHFTGIKKILKINTDLGFNVKVSKNHKVKVLRGNEYEWVKAKDLNVGDSFCVNPNSLTRNKSLKLNLTPFQTFLDNSPRPDNFTIVKKPKYMTLELAYILGALVSEGSLKRKKFIISNNNIEYLNKIKNYLEIVFGIEAKIYVNRKKDDRGITNWVLYVGSVAISAWMVELGDNFKLSGDKRIPWSIFQADEQSQLSFIASYIEGDGYISEGRIGICSKSKVLLSQFQLLLHSHGIILINPSRKTKKGKDTYTASTDFAHMLYHKIEPYLIFKHNKAYSKLPTKNGRNYGFSNKGLNEFFKSRKVSLPNYTTECRTDKGSVIALSNCSYSDKNSIFNGNSRMQFLYSEYDDGMYDGILKDLKRLSISEYKKVKFIIDTRYWHTQITSIKEIGEKKVYDLTIDSDYAPAFTANGIVIHNSTWEFNPNITRADLQQKYNEDPIAAERDFGANPPFGISPFIKGPSSLVPVFSDEKNCFVNSGYKVLEGSLNESLLYPKIGFKSKHTYPSILSLDCGYTNNSFSCVLSHLELDNDGNKVFVVSGIIEIVPVPFPISFVSVYEKVICRIIENYNVVLCCFDRWQSIDLSQRIFKDYGIPAFLYSVKYAEFELFKSEVYGGTLQFPKLESSLEDLIELDAEMSSLTTLKPVNHLFLQLLMCKDTGRMVTKGDDVTDDILRALVLGYAVINKEEYEELFTGLGSSVNTNYENIHSIIRVGFKSVSNVPANRPNFGFQNKTTSVNGIGSFRGKYNGLR